MCDFKGLVEKFESAYEDNDLVDRAKFDAVMKDDKKAPKIVLADILFELLQLSKKISCIDDRLAEVEESY